MDLILHTILPFAGILIVLIVVHELGHYITAKLTGVKVLEAGLGYPPRIWGFTWRGTLYSINGCPWAASCGCWAKRTPSDPGSLAAKPRWVRLIVLFAGSGMNFLLPIFLFALAFMIPRDVSVGLTQITGVAPQSPGRGGRPEARRRHLRHRRRQGAQRARGQPGDPPQRRRDRGLQRKARRRRSGGHTRLRPLDAPQEDQGPPASRSAPCTRSRRRRASRPGRRSPRAGPPPSTP